MGHKKLEINVYSCQECGWIDTEPRVTRVKALGHDEIGKVRLGPRGGQVYLRFECPLCHVPIKPSPPIDLLQVGSAEERKTKGGNNNGTSDPDE